MPVRPLMRRWPLAGWLGALLLRHTGSGYWGPAKAAGHA
jgi:hypothetical protein